MTQTKKVLHITICIALVLAGMLAAATFSSQRISEDELWAAVADGSHFVIMRHALAPGTGDPDEFSLGDCSTQRNLSDQGREQAQRIGDQFRARGIAAADVFTSQWCRCRDTAEELQLGTVTELPPINSFFRDRSRAGQQTAQLIQWLKARESAQPLILVTHMVNIYALTDTVVASGEFIVFKLSDDDTVALLGSIKTAY